eukprot:583203-Rhodomonas_salina.3
MQEPYTHTNLRTNPWHNKRSAQAGRGQTDWPTKVRSSVGRQPRYSPAYPCVRTTSLNTASELLYVGFRVSCQPGPLP